MTFYGKYTRWKYNTLHPPLHVPCFFISTKTSFISSPSSHLHTLLLSLIYKSKHHSSEARSQTMEHLDYNPHPRILGGRVEELSDLAGDEEQPPTLNPRRAWWVLFHVIMRLHYSGIMTTVTLFFIQVQMLDIPVLIQCWIVVNKVRRFCVYVVVDVGLVV